jgi:hypothetical protein
MPSNFESLPLPVTKDSQDYVRLIPAGQTVEIPVVGDFIYCKFSDGEIRVVINGKSTNMESGDERRSGDGTVFRGVNLINETAVDKAVVFVIGFGSFNRRIVQGNVSIEPILRSADGTTKADTRYDLDVSLNPYNLETTPYEAGEVIRATSGVLVDASSSQDEFLTPNPDGTLWAVYVGNNDDFNTFRWNPKTGLFLGELSNYDLRFPPGGGPRTTFFNKSGTLFYVNAEGNAYICTPNSDGVDFTFEANLQRPGGTFKFASTDFAENVIYCVNNDAFVVVYDLDTFAFKREFQVTFNVGSTASGFFDNATDQLVFANIGDIWRFVDKFTGVQQSAKSAGFDIYKSSEQYVQGNGNEVFEVGISGVTATLRKRALKDFETKAEFFAVRPECVISASLRNFQAIQTTANITVEKTLNGVLVSGEVIKAALEFYFGRSMPVEYLDHVYYFDSSNNGFKAVSSGNKTFLAANIDDNFAIRTPTNLIIKLDNDIELGALL